MKLWEFNKIPTKILQKFSTTAIIYIKYLFYSETSDLNTGLLMEVWNKGMIWDRAMGYHWVPLRTVHYSNEVSLVNSD